MTNRFKKNSCSWLCPWDSAQKSFSFFNKSSFLLKKDVRVQLLFQFGFDFLRIANKDVQLKHSEGEMQGGSDNRRLGCAAQKSSEEQIEHSLPELSGCSLQLWASHLIICYLSVGAACRRINSRPLRSACQSNLRLLNIQCVNVKARRYRWALYEYVCSKAIVSHSCRFSAWCTEFLGSAGSQLSVQL